ncbi:MAG: GTP-binding protein [Methylophaga sp.]|nr:MAG: GTP-binding protein [Methylophaga sp.]
MAENDPKIIFTGSIRAGVKTAIRAVSVSDTAIKKEFQATTMAYGVLKLENGRKIQLYGTLDQEQLELMADILSSDCIGLALLIDNSRENPIADLKFFLNTFSDFITETNIVVGVAQMDLTKKTSLEDYRVELKSMSLNPPLFEVDVRQKKDISLLVQALLSLH